MQLARWRLTRTARIVLIILVVQMLGLGPVMLVVPGGIPDSGGLVHHPPGDPLDAALTPDLVLDGSGSPGWTAFADRSQDLPPASALFPRRLLRAPPAS